MATIAELKDQLAAQENVIKSLRPPVEAAKATLNQAQAALDAFQAQPNRLSISALIAVKKSAEANPTNTILQQQVQTVQAQWDAQQAVYLPLLNARDQASTALITANGPLGKAEAVAADIEISIAKIDPTQASPEAVQYLKENDGLPVVASSDPALPQVNTDPNPNAVITPGTGTNPVAGVDITGNTVSEKATSTPPAVVATGTAYDDNGFLNPGWSLDENNNPVRVDNNFVEQATINSAKESYYSAANKNGTAYDDNGFLNPGWTLDENNDPVYVGGPFVEQATISSANETRAAKAAANGTAYDDDGNLNPGWALDENNNPVWVSLDYREQGGPKDGSPSSAGGKVAAKSSNSASSQSTGSADDWRVRLSLASKANYLYNVATEKDILFPLKGTNGVVFPYTPQINTSYRANYDPAELTHNNYKMHFYKNSSIDDVTITADFTAQDTREANYMLAVIHFFKSVTKMFYGADISPRPGTPPPLVYLTGFGSFQFDNHPLAVTNFQYNLPNDVDYIRAGATKSWGGSSITSLASQGKATTASKIRAALSGLKAGAAPAAPQFTNLGSKEVTYVPTKIQLSITLIPIVTRSDISKRFSLTDYATGKLLQGSKNSGGGIW